MDSGRCSPPQKGSPIPHKLSSLDFEEVCCSQTHVYYLNIATRSIMTYIYCDLSDVDSKS